jgi:hypothetical protein
MATSETRATGTDPARSLACSDFLIKKPDLTPIGHRHAEQYFPKTSPDWAAAAAFFYEQPRLITRPSRLTHAFRLGAQDRRMVVSAATFEHML